MSPPFRHYQWLRLATAIGLFGLTILLGWTVAGNSSGSKETERSAATKEPPRRLTRTPHEPRRTPDERLETIRETPLPEDRLRKTIEMAHSLDTGDFREWAERGWFNFREGFELTLFRRIVEERWRAEDPDGYVLWVMENGGRGPVWSADITTQSALPILSNLATSDSSRLHQLFTDYPDESLETRVLNQLVAENPTQVLDYIRNSGFLPNQGNQMFTTILDQLATTIPRQLEASLSELPFIIRTEAEKILYTDFSE